MFTNIFTHVRQILTCLTLVVTGLMLAPSSVWAQSACTAMWGIVGNGGGTATLGFYNNSAGTAAKFTLLPFTLTGNANALAGDPATGLLYYWDRTGTALSLHSVNLNTNTDTTVGTVAPASPDGNGNIFGALVDNSSRLILMSSLGTSGAPYHLSVASKTGNTTNASWITVTNAISGLPVQGAAQSGGSGDIFLDRNNQIWLITNTAPSASLYPLTVTFSAGGTITAVVAGTPTTYTGTPASIQGVSLNPVTGINYFAGVTAGNIASSFTPGVANTNVTVDTISLGVTDLGNCILTPAVPTISKSFSPTYQPVGSATTTLALFIGNPNSQPIWLNQTFTDSFPAGMAVAAVPNLNSGACSAQGTTVTNVITATSGLSTLTFAAGGRVPAGGCTITVSVTAPASANLYTNTIAIGALSTTSGVNAGTVSAVYKVGTDFSAVKSQCQGVCGVTTTSTISTYGNQTQQYVLTITNSTVGGTGTVSFTDTLPTLMTPVLSITAAATGGGTCTTASAVVGGATQITGIFGNAPAGAQCNVTVTTLVNPQAASITVTNTLTVAPAAGTSDTNALNNTAAVLTNVGPSTVLTVTKTNGVTSLLAGSTTSYTVTVSNLGPANAPNSVVKDPAVPGLSCTAVTCPVGNIVGTASCPITPTVALLQGAGLVVPIFNAGSSVTFVVNCDVTATGQ
jgi:uncharacterized repeat protein (TIGR01451 family)